MLCSLPPRSSIPCHLTCLLGPSAKSPNPIRSNQLVIALSLSFTACTDSLMIFFSLLFPQCQLCNLFSSAHPPNSDILNIFFSLLILAAGGFTCITVSQHPGQIPFRPTPPGLSSFPKWQFQSDSSYPWQQQSDQQPLALTSPCEESSDNIKM